VLTKKWNPILLRVFILIHLSLLLWGQANAQPAIEDKNFQVQFELTVDAARKTLDALETELAVEKQQQKEDVSRLQIYKTQANSLRNFLLVPEISILVLEKGVEEVDISISLIKSKIQKNNEKANKTELNIVAVKEKIHLIDQRIIESDSLTDKASNRIPGIKEFRSYRSILEKQHQGLLSIMDIQSVETKDNIDLLRSFEDIRLILKKEIKDKKGTLLFQRNEIELKDIWPQNFISELLNSVANSRQWFTSDLISQKWSQSREHINLKGILIVSAFMVFSFFFFQGLSYLRQNESFQGLLKKRVGYPLVVFEKSRFLIFWILLTIVISKTQIYLIFPDFIKFFKTFLSVILLTKIVSDSIRLIVNEKSPNVFKTLYKWRNAFVWGIRLYSFLYLLMYRFLSLDTEFLIFFRIFSEAALVICVFLFWKAYQRIENPINDIGMKLLTLWSKAVVLSGLFADISGYSHFASWWYISWSVSIVIACVLSLLLYSLKDIDQKFKEKFEPESSSPYGISYPFYWILSNGLIFFLVLSAVTGLAFSWSTNTAFLAWLWEIFNQKFAIGKIELSLAGFVYSFFTILLTYLFTHLIKKIMAGHVLKGSGLSSGAKDSVISIFVYIAWTAGILVSLSVFGIDTTSLTVVFGALGIGLGFGLQNIFNNFISGLILLFERPIQVGDIVEVAGEWGEVKKINVRSTLVQTYTNSSLIIPNSEFISAKVTNWSHKDPFIRRDLLVGVAYGSDTALVKNLLLQTADSVAQVYDYPQKPKVQFINFGDSSLDFRLRFWSDIDNFIEAESKLRFEIDQIFKENKVTIPFPQRDVHILGNPTMVKSKSNAQDSAETSD